MVILYIGTAVTRPRRKERMRRKIAKTKKEKMSERVKAKEKTEAKGEETSADKPSRRWCLTLYPERLIADKILLPDSEPQDIVREVYKHMERQLKSLRGGYIALEKGDSKEHEHLQIYIEMRKPCRWKAIAKSVGCGVHVERAWGDRDDNHDYIFHEGKHENKGTLIFAQQYGEFPVVAQNEEGAYSQAINMALEGVSLRVIATTLGGSILPQIGNLSRLIRDLRQEEIDILTNPIRQAKNKEEWFNWQRNNEEIAF